jgi:hypothetical protein
VKIRRTQAALRHTNFRTVKVEAARPRPPGEVGQVALIPPMDGRRGYRTARAARRRRRRRELEPHGCILNGDLAAAELTGG